MALSGRAVYQDAEDSKFAITIDGCRKHNPLNRNVRFMLYIRYDQFLRNTEVTPKCVLFCSAASLSFYRQPSIQPTQLHRKAAGRELGRAKPPSMLGLFVLVCVRLMRIPIAQSSQDGLLRLLYLNSAFAFTRNLPNDGNGFVVTVLRHLSWPKGRWSL